MSAFRPGSNDERLAPDLPTAPAALERWVAANMGEALSLTRASDNRLVYVNPAWDAMYRRPPGRPPGAAGDRLDPSIDGLPSLIAEIRAGAGRGRWEGEVRCWRFDGTAFWTRTTVSPLTHPVHGPVLIGVQTDITEARQAHDLMDRIFESTIDLLAIATPDGHLRRLNPAWERTLGWTAQELSAMSLDELAHPDDRERVRAFGERAVDEPVVGFEGRWRGADGRYHWLQVNTVPTSDPPLVVANARDITEQKRHEHETEVLLAEKTRTEAELRTSEERFRSIFDNAPLGVVTTSLRPDDLGNFLEVNEAFCALFGYRRDDLVGKSMFDLFPPPDVEQAQARMRQLGSDTTPVVVEARGRRADGQLRELRSITSVIARGDEPDYALTLVEDVTVRKQLERELARRALYDELTGLANRHLFLDRLALALEQRHRDDSDLAVIYLDLDHFKDLNDSLGHHLGDQVLAEFGQRLRTEVRAVDTPARLAGDEFVVLCPNVGTAANATHIVERLHTALRRPVRVDDRNLVVGTSMGVAVTHAAVTDVDSLMHAADVALFHAKRRGRDRWELYTDTLGHQTRHRHETEQLLRDGLEHDRFRLHYQPVVDLGTGGIVGVEALLRLDDPAKGLLPPSAFIDVAEDSELIVPIGEWVITHACRHAAQWNQAFGPLEVAVNLSARQLAHPDIVDHIRTTLTTTDLHPTRLCLELTERVLIDATEPTTDDLGRLSDDGIGLALDDFGTGYSSLLQLKRFPITTIKIDRTFVADLERRPDDSAIVHAITTLARDLHLTTIAEGIETPQQLELLQSLGCDHAQGFLLHRPQPTESLTALLGQDRTGPP